MFQWGRESQLSSSVPVSVISNLPDYQVTSDNKRRKGGGVNTDNWMGRGGGYDGRFVPKAIFETGSVF